MSKTRLNGIDPADAIARHGIDAMRLALFFAAPFEFDMEWDDRMAAGCARFGKRLAAVCDRLAASEEQDGDKAAEEGFAAEQHAFRQFCHVQFERGEGLNGLVAAIMKRTTQIEAANSVGARAKRGACSEVCKALSPMAPGLAADCGRRIEAGWEPRWASQDASEATISAATVKVALQWAGKFIEAIDMPAGIDAKRAYELGREGSVRFDALAAASAEGWEGCVWIPGRALNGSRGPRAKPEAPAARGLASPPNSRAHGAP